ncbi:MAG: hypothetical protein EOL91_13805 [Actinobacteria bacterium]|nr:hypothetical protein [Actinomycetota bacterium]
MSHRTKAKRKPWSWVETLRLRWQRSSTSWRLGRSTRRLKKLKDRETLLLVAMDSLLLEQKELEEQVFQDRRRLTEMQGSRVYRTQGLLTETPASYDPEQTELLDRMLGLDSTQQP